jgi:hypothetical protein
VTTCPLCCAAQTLQTIAVAQPVPLQRLLHTAAPAECAWPCPARCLQADRIADLIFRKLLPGLDCQGLVDLLEHLNGV